MKKQKEYFLIEWFDSYGWGILATIIVIAVLWFLIGNSANLNKPQFTIYKTECHNETIGRELIETKNITWTKVVYGDCPNGYSFEEDYFSWIKFNPEFECNSKKCIFTQNDCEIFISEENYSFQNEVWEDSKREVCEPKEVDEIPYCKEGYTLSGEQGKRNSEYPYWIEQQICFNDSNDPFFYFPPEKISKANLTLDWLNENCECWFCKEWYEGDECWLKEYPEEYEINKYKCGNYTVEVK